FAEVCGCSWKDLEADQIEYERWRSERKPNADDSTALSENQIKAFHKRLCGYYELYHHATSKRWTPAISVSLVHIDGFDSARSALKCELYDANEVRSYFHLRGSVIPMGGFLYWQLAHDLLGAVCHGYCYNPTDEKYP